MELCKYWLSQSGVPQRFPDSMASGSARSLYSSRRNVQNGGKPQIYLTIYTIYCSTTLLYCSIHGVQTITAGFLGWDRAYQSGIHWWLLKLLPDVHFTKFLFHFLFPRFLSLLQNLSSTSLYISLTVLLEELFKKDLHQSWSHRALGGS